MKSIEEKLGQLLISRGLTVATAESCTGGLVSSKLTDVAGSSAYVKLNFVTYANEAKTEILGVKPSVFTSVGAVSEECAYEMARGLQKRTQCDVAICTTGVAGPLKDEGKPAGLVYISIAFRDNIRVHKVFIEETLSKHDMKERFANKALELAYDIISKEIAQ